MNYNYWQKTYMGVDSHGQARGTETYTRCANFKRIHPRLKTWPLCGLRISWEALCEQSEHEGESLTALQTEGATQAPVIETERQRDDYA